MVRTKAEALKKKPTTSTAPTKSIAKKDKPVPKSKKQPHKAMIKRPVEKISVSAHKARLAAEAAKIASTKKFSSKEAEKKFNQLKKKPLLVEKGFVALEVDKPLPDFIAEVIQQHSWQNFCEPPTNPIIPFVREFYANLAFEEEGCSPESMVRGMRIVVNADSINAAYALTISGTDEFGDLVNTPRQEHFTEILQVAALKDAEWDVSCTGIRSIKFQCLTPEASIWLHFVKSRLMPTTHDSTVSANRMLLLYSILKGLRINVGKIISEEITSCATKKSGKLFFPSLITRLCLAAGVKKESGDEVLTERNHIVYLRLYQKHDPNRPSISAAPSSGPETTSSQSDKGKLDQIHGQLMVLLEQQGVLYKRFAHMEEQNQIFMKYVKARDSVLNKNLRTIATRPIPSLPKFPDQLFQPWTTLTDDDAVPTSSDEPEE